MAFRESRTDLCKDQHFRDSRPPTFRTSPKEITVPSYRPEEASNIHRLYSSARWIPILSLEWCGHASRILQRTLIQALGWQSLIFHAILNSQQRPPAFYAILLIDISNSSSMTFKVSDRLFSTHEYFRQPRLRIDMFLFPPSL